jgi:hypothetical protein
MLIGLFLYWAVGVFVMCANWLEDFDTVDMETLMMVMVFFWPLWPLFAIGMAWRAIVGQRLSEIVVYRKSRAKRK